MSLLERRAIKSLTAEELSVAIEMTEQKLEAGETLTRADINPIRKSIGDGVKLAEGAWYLSVPVKGDILPPNDPSLDLIWEEDGRFPERIKLDEKGFTITRDGEIRIVGLYEGREIRSLSLMNHPDLYLKAAKEVIQTFQAYKESPEDFYLTRSSLERYAILRARSTPNPAKQP